MPFGYTKAQYDNAPPISFVQENNTEIGSSPGDTTTVSFGSPQKRGNCNIVFVSVSVGADFTSVTDLVGNTYTQLTSQLVTENPGGQVRTVFVYTCINIKAAPMLVTSSNTITVTCTTAGLDLIVMAAEYSGPIGFIESFQTVVGAQSPSGTITNISPVAMIVSGACGWNTSATPAVGAGFTQRINVKGGTESYLLQDQLVLVPGSNAVAMTNIGPSGSTVGCVMITMVLR